MAGAVQRAVVSATRDECPPPAAHRPKQTFSDIRAKAGYAARYLLNRRCDADLSERAGPRSDRHATSTLLCVSACCSPAVCRQSNPISPRFDVGVFPSRWEGFGLVAAECMAAGVPVVGSDIPAFREVIGDAGALVEPESAPGVAQAVTTLLSDDRFHDRRAEQGRERVRERFSADSTAVQYAALYRSVG